MKTLKPVSMSVLQRVFEVDERCFLTVSALACVSLVGPAAGPMLEAEIWRSFERAMGPSAVLDDAMPKGRGEVLLAACACAPDDAPDVTVGVRLGSLEVVQRAPVGPLALASFAPLGIGDSERTARVGTSDANWFREDHPGLPKDLDRRGFNVAPDAMQIDGFFLGNEDFSLTGMSRDRPRIEGCLPGLAARAFVSRHSRFEEIPMRLDTVHLLVDELRAVLIFRGVAEVSEHDADDVTHLLLAWERFGAPRPVEHYQGALARRTSGAGRGRAALRDDELSIEGAPGADALVAASGAPRREGAAAARERDRAAAELRSLRYKLGRLGVDEATFAREPAPDGPRLAAPPAEDFAAAISLASERNEAAQATAATRRVEVEALARALCDRCGVDYDEVVTSRGGPPEVTTSRGAARLLAAYRAAAHRRPAARPVGEADRMRARQQWIERIARGESLAGADLTGADLSRLSLVDIDLREALLEGADLTGADLTGADLTGAVLVRAVLDDATLTDARLARANLGYATLIGARASEGVDLTDATLWNTNLAGCSLRGVTLGAATLTGADLSKAQLEGLSARGATFIKVDLTGARLTAASLQKALFVECALSKTDLRDARLKGATWVGSRGEDTCFARAEAENIRMVEGCSFERADFQGARLQGSTLRGTRLAGANFTRANADRADFSSCDLRGATLTQCSVRDGLLIRADLTDAVMTAAGLLGAVMQAATVQGANLRDAVLFGAHLTRWRGDPASVEGAVMSRTSLRKGVS